MRWSLKFLRDRIKDLNSKEDIMSVFNESTFEITRSMERLNTHQKFRTVAKNRGILEEPKYFIVNENLIQVLGEFEEEKATGCIMPIEHQIISFLKCPGILENILRIQNDTNNVHGFRNVVDGSLWKEVIAYYREKDEHAIVIPIHFYGDDFNIDNVVSPHSESTKMTAYYYHFPTIPDYITTKIENIFLPLVHRSKDVDSEKSL